jgi:hypothetical protein
MDFWLNPYLPPTTVGHHSGEESVAASKVKVKVIQLVQLVPQLLTAHVRVKVG